MERDAAAIRASGLFDEQWYTEQYPDVKILGIDPVEHYLLLGAALGRNPSQKFDGANYSKQEGVVNGTNPLLHFIHQGAKAAHSTVTLTRDQLEKFQAEPLRKTAGPSGDRVFHFPPLNLKGKAP
jgi:hypothetical protein